MTQRDGRDKSTVRATKTSFEVVECVQHHRGATLKTIAEELEKAKSTIHRHLNTLEDMGYLERDGEQFRVGHRFIKLGETARTKEEEYRLAAKKVEEFAEKTGERAQFVVEEGGSGFCIYRSTGEQGVDTEPRVGSLMPLHATAAGKAIVAYETDDRRESLIDACEFETWTNETITDEDAYRDELAKTSARGYAINRNEHIDGLTALGAPVQDSDGHVIGSFSISGPTHRYDSGTEDEIINVLQGTTNELELNIQFGENIDR